LTLADLIAARAEQVPDFDVVTFDGGGVRAHEVRTYADLWMNCNRIAAGLMASGLAEMPYLARVFRDCPIARKCTNPRQIEYSLARPDLRMLVLSRYL